MSQNRPWVWGSSPRMRGTPRRRLLLAAESGIIPAHAGNTRIPARRRMEDRDHPRACGEHTTKTLPLGHYTGSSPRMRGTPDLHVAVRRVDGIIPAHAGNTRTAIPRQWGPRGSSPRMRGTRSLGLPLRVALGIIPAHAGNTYVVKHIVKHCRDHPRACGEHFQTD